MRPYFLSKGWLLTGGMRRKREKGDEKKDEGEDEEEVDAEV